jgi:hypothetical protein
MVKGSFGAQLEPTVLQDEQIDTSLDPRLQIQRNLAECCNRRQKTSWIVMRYGDNQLSESSMRPNTMSEHKAIISWKSTSPDFLRGKYLASTPGLSMAA